MRPEATNTGGWVDAEDSIAETCGQMAGILAVAVELHAHELDEGQRLMLLRAIDLLEILGHEDDEPDDG